MEQSTIKHSKKKIFDAVKKAAISLELEVRSESSSKFEISLFSNGGLFSYGNIIDIRVKYLESSKSILEVHSESAATIQIIDWGTNSDLENKLINEVEIILEG